ncbi:MAG: hypothetical protein KDI63_11715 [Gammaproteobacteria bacterium]|nr:hypothetical protein [Gammaproteobacteria bacterium]
MHTHFINSPLDVPQVGRLGSVAAFFRGSGLKNTRYHLTTSGNLLATQIRQTRSEDPHARIALVGWSGASLWVWDALNHLSDTGEKVDLIVYLDSNWIKQRVAERGHPNNLARALLIYRINNPPVTKVPNSTVTIIPTMNHLAVAAHPVSVRTIGRALIDLLLDQPNLSR